MTYWICPKCGYENPGIDLEEEEPICEVCDGYLEYEGTPDEVDYQQQSED